MSRKFDNFTPIKKNFSCFYNSMEIKNKNFNYTFQARPGKRLTKLVRKEFVGDEAKITKFKNLFDKVHNNLDTNTVINIDKKERYVFFKYIIP